MKPVITLYCGIAFASLAPAYVAASEYVFESRFGSPGTAPGQFDAPRGVALNAHGQIIVTESGNHRVQVCSDDGVCTAFGSFGEESGQFDRPRGVGVNGEGQLFVADRGNDRIQECTTSGVCTAFGGSGTGAGQFESPRGIAITADDRIIVTDTENNRVQICTDQGACSVFGSLGTALGRFDSPAGVAVDGAGRLVIADRGNDRIQICSEQGSCSAFGSHGSAPGQFDYPAGVAVDSEGRIVIVDRFNDRVQVCSEDGVCTAFGSGGSGDGQFSMPWGVAVDGNDRIVVADLGNDRIQIFAKKTTTVVIDSFTATPGLLMAGESVTLSWSVSHATSCEALGGTASWRSILPDPEGGSTTIVLPAAGEYEFVLQCSNGSSTVSAQRHVSVTAAATFSINAGLNDAWFDPETAGQGFFVTVFPEIGHLFVAWFTYDLERPDGSVTASIGDPGHRWLTAFGPYSGNEALLDIEVTRGGVFDTPDPGVTQVIDGSMSVLFSNCNAATVDYEIPSLGIFGSVPIQRIALDNVAVCEALAGE